MNNVKIAGTGSYVPKNVVTNYELSKIVDTNDEWISSRTGIKERRISTEENTSILASKAALAAIKNTNINPLEIDIIIVATTSPDNFTPSTACLVQGAIGADNATCFDISAACSGFIYGLNVASQFIKTGQSKIALVIGADVLSKIVDWKDRSTCILFGDGAGAAILMDSEENGVKKIYTGSIGKDGEYLKCSAIPVNNFLTNKVKKYNNFINMDGKAIFKFSTEIIPKAVKSILEDTDYNIDDIKYIVPHQANARILEFAAKKLNVKKDKFYVNIDKYGNTSAASIAIALDEISKSHLIKKGEKLILVGFGGGLTFGSILIEWLI